MQFIRLEEQQRTQRRTGADALDVLSRYSDLQACNHLQFKIGGIVLPSGDIVGIANLFCELQAPGKTLIVSLAASKAFRARSNERSELNTFDISALDGASLKLDGSVEMRNRTVFRSIEVLPSKLPYELSELDWRILHRVISLMGIEGQCYIRPDYFGPSVSVQNNALIDFSTLKGRITPLLKQIQGDPSDWDRLDKAPSQQKIADTLAKVGMRRPARRTQQARM
jgi:hypothetical protein